MSCAAGYCKLMVASLRLRETSKPTCFPAQIQYDTFRVLQGGPFRRTAAPIQGRAAGAEVFDPSISF
jgi:hypothetical protein